MDQYLTLLAGTYAPLERLRNLVDLIRPSRGQRLPIDTRILQLAQLLESHPEARASLRSAIVDVLSQRHAVLLFADTGIFPANSVWVETLRRISHRLLPEADDEQQLKNAFGQIFLQSDSVWLEKVDLVSWQALFDSLDFDMAWASDLAPGSSREPPDHAAAWRLQQIRRDLQIDLAEAIRVVAHRIAAEGLEPEVLRLDPTLENHHSPFLAQCQEALRLADHAESAADDPVPGRDAYKQLVVLLDQCQATIERVRKLAQRKGASFHLTSRLRRTEQHVERLHRLTALVPRITEDDTQQTPFARFWVDLVVADCKRNRLQSYWQQNVELVALRVTENASKSGEHYITRTRSEYMTLLRAAAGGGAIIALIATIKFGLSALHLPPLIDILASSFNYGLGFVLIHVLHWAVATKQPAMTANAIAAVIENTATGEAKAVARFDKLIELVARTVRSQLAAIIGNIGLAVPVALSLAFLIRQLTGAHFISPEKANATLHSVLPLSSAALIFAALAGVCLFLAGLIAGYFDNLCMHNKIPARVAQLRAPIRWFGLERWQRFATYLESNLGALTGNFSLGFLLAGTAGLGSLLGLPIDVRHVTLAAANWGYALEALDFKVDFWLALSAAIGIGLIGLTNLLVSFYLAIWVGLKARGVAFRQRAVFIGAVMRRFREQPGQFLLPPRQEA